MIIDTQKTSTFYHWSPLPIWASLFHVPMSITLVLFWANGSWFYLFRKLKFYFFRGIYRKMKCKHKMTKNARRWPDEMSLPNARMGRKKRSNKKWGRRGEGGRKPSWRGEATTTTSSRDIFQTITNSSLSFFFHSLSLYFFLFPFSFFLSFLEPNKERWFFSSRSLALK